MSADFLLELLSEEIPARMQARARNDLARMFAEALSAAGLIHDGIVTYSMPRRLALIARGLPLATEAVSEELKGPRTGAPPQALDGFLRKTGLSQDQLEDRDGTWFARIEKPGRATSEVLAEAVAAIVRDFPWPKSMRWGAASQSTASLRWVRPLHSIVALLGEEIVPVAIEGVECGATTRGHRFHHPGPITIGGAGDYVEKLRACHVIVDQEERETIIRDGAAAAAKKAGFTLVEDEGLVVENAGLTSLPVPLLGSFDPAFLNVPEEVIQLTARINQKYFVMRDGDGKLAPHFVCVANINANDDGAAIVAGNERVLAARLADARFFWEHDLRVPLEEQAKKLGGIVFHEKLGTVADKVERVAKLARWLVEEGIVGAADDSVEEFSQPRETPTKGGKPVELPSIPRDMLADMAERAARLAKADLVTGMVGEFPELQGVIGGHLARAQGEPDAVADAIRDHYKPVGQGDEVPTAPVTVAVSLADKLDSIAAFFAVDERPSGSKDPFALRRAALAAIRIILANELRIELVRPVIDSVVAVLVENESRAIMTDNQLLKDMLDAIGREDARAIEAKIAVNELAIRKLKGINPKSQAVVAVKGTLEFFADRLKVQQRDAGVRYDLIDAVFALGGEDDLVRLLARVEALQQFVETPEGADLLATYKRAGNILKKERWEGSHRRGIPQTGDEDPHVLVDESVMSEAVTGLTTASTLPADAPAEERALVEALDEAEPKAIKAITDEDFTTAMAALATLRGPIDTFFDKVTVNDPDAEVRRRRLDLLARFRDTVDAVADFSKIEG
ncbi:MAG: glycine--tRNA ligase subunit beta [Pseudomonadota bacterium]|nr:glycine--tRNA ligase subunit beta [Pseudomonadota bacterium]